MENMLQEQLNQYKNENFDPTFESMGKDVYLDRDQCESFGAEYFSKCNFYISADVLLGSKNGDGYDKNHQEILKPLGIDYVYLTRENGAKPGWFKISDIVKA